jgi:hypothetical protein
MLLKGIAVGIVILALMMMQIEQWLCRPRPLPQGAPPDTAESKHTSNSPSPPHDVVRTDFRKMRRQLSLSSYPIFFTLAIFLLATVAALSPSHPSNAVDVYVAPTGSDAAGCGETDSPCQTMQGALKYNDAVAISISLAAGAYAPPPAGVDLSHRDVSVVCAQAAVKSQMQCTIDCGGRGPFVAASQQSIIFLSLLSISNCVASFSSPSPLSRGGGAINAGALHIAAHLLHQPARA